MFNKETEYALRGLVYIQSQNSIQRRPGVAEIAKEVEAPSFFIAKILQRLVKQGVLLSAKGKGGGFYFEEGKADFSIRELVSITGGTKIIHECGFGLKQCDCEHPCPLHEQYKPIREAIDQLLSTETIQSLSEKLILR